MSTEAVLLEGRVDELRLPLGEITLEGTLALPNHPQGLVLFAHGSGSSRHSPRNQFVANSLQRSGFATLLFDLLTSAEEQLDRETAELRFDIRLLARRLTAVTSWMLRQESVRGLPLGYFGASTGAAAALSAAARLRESVVAVVSRGGRPDLAAADLGFVKAPTLLLVGGEDRVVLDLNRAALAKLRCPGKTLVVIPHASHLFEETGALDEVARLAADWFCRYLVCADRPQKASAA